MNIFYLLIGVSLFAAFIFLGLFIWNIKNGQYEDDYTPAVRMLFEDEPTQTQEPTNLTTDSETDGNSNI